MILKSDDVLFEVSTFNEVERLKSEDILCLFSVDKVADKIFILDVLNEPSDDISLYNKFY